MLYVMEVVFSVCIVERGAVAPREWEVCVLSCICCILCASCGSPQCCVLHDLQFFNKGRRWKMHTPEPVS